MPLMWHCPTHTHFTHTGGNGGDNGVGVDVRTRSDGDSVCNGVGVHDPDNGGCVSVVAEKGQALRASAIREFLRVTGSSSPAGISLRHFYDFPSDRITQNVSSSDHVLVSIRRIVCPLFYIDTL